MIRCQNSREIIQIVFDHIKGYLFWGNNYLFQQKQLGLFNMKSSHKILNFQIFKVKNNGNNVLEYVTNYKFIKAKF